MANAKRYIGEDIYFSIKKQKSDLTYRNLDNYADIFVYISGAQTTLKFSKTAKTGYITLTRVSSTEYAAYITSANTALLGVGYLTISCDFITTSESSDLRDNKKSSGTLLYLDTNPIQGEL